MNYWISHSLSYGIKNYDGRQCCISVAMDAGAHVAFSGIRVIIVGQEGDNFTDLFLYRCHDSYRLGFYGLDDKDSRKMTPLIPSPSYGVKLRSSRHQIRTSREDAYTAHSHRETAVCSFKLLYRLERSCYDLVPLGNQSNGSSSTGKLVKIFDNTWPLLPDQQSIIFYLESPEHCFDRFLPDILRFYSRAFVYLPCYEARVIPVNRTPRISVALPPNIIRQIVDHTIDYESGWRDRLLSCALVQKSWLQVTELFFQALGKTRRVMGSPIKFAHSLEYQSRCRNLIKGFDDLAFECDYMDQDLELINPEWLSPFRTILDLGAASIRTLNLHKPAFILAYDFLKDMKVVEHFALDLSSMISDNCDEFFEYNPDIPRPVHLLMIEELLRGWEHLHILSLEGWDDPEEAPIVDHENRPVQLATRLRELQLSNGVVSGDHLYKFFSHALSKVSLKWIRGLTNSELRDFLLSVAPTIESLTLHECEIYRSSGEQHAIEAALPQMQSLMYLRAAGEEFTGRIIAWAPGSLKALVMIPQTGN